jgi:hypothetical protein
MSAAGRNDLSLVSAVDRGHALSLVGLVRSWSVVRTPLPGIRVGRVRAGHGLGLRTVGRGAAPRRIAGGLHPGAHRHGGQGREMGHAGLLHGPGSSWSAGLVKTWVLEAVA